MPKLRIDQREVAVPPGTTLLEAARKIDIDIPALCCIEGYKPSTSCLACLVRVRGNDHLVLACDTRAEDGMEIESETDEIRRLRRTALELILSHHTGDCSAPCHRADACLLRHYATLYGVERTASIRPNPTSQHILRPGGVVYDPGKCILCELCSRIAATRGEPLGLSVEGCGFNVQAGVSGNRFQEQALQQIAIECAAKCPTAALSFKESAHVCRTTDGCKGQYEDRKMSDSP